MANNTTIPITIAKEVLVFSIVFKFIAMGIGVMGNTAVIYYNIFMQKENTTTSYLVANLAVADLLICLTYPLWIIEFIQTILDVDSDQELFCKLSRPSSFAFLFVSIASLSAITFDRYLLVVRPLRYSMVVTCRRVLAAVLGIWLTSCGLIPLSIVQYKEELGFRSLCDPPETIYWFERIAVVYFPLVVIFALNFKILKVSRKQRKRILTECTAVMINNSNEPLSNCKKVSHIIRFLLALKAAKTFFIVVILLTICILIPTLVGFVLTETCRRTLLCEQIWYVVVNYELYGINSLVNPFIYGVRHLKYRRAYGHIFFKLLHCWRS